MTEQHKNHCPACGHIMAKPKRGLSTIEFRRTVHKCAPANGQDKDSLRENVYKLIKLFRNITQDVKLTVAFFQDFEIRLDDNSQDSEMIKLWLLEQVNRLDRDVGEKAVYQLLSDLYAEDGVNTPFAVFYNIYAARIDNPLSKNSVSRALRALGLKTRMVRMIVDGREKSVISIRATAVELENIFRKNGSLLVGGRGY